MSEIEPENKEKIIQLYFNSFKNDNIEPNVTLSQVKNNHKIITVKKYFNFKINDGIYPIYFLSFPYENDEIYKSLILSNKDMDDGLILYEKVVDEGEYLRMSKISNNTIKNLLYNIEYYNYDKEGNIMSNKKKRDSTLIRDNVFSIKNNHFKIENNRISESWFGKYTFTINENSEDWRDIQDITLTIKQDSIIFHAEGYQIDQNYLLSYKQEKNNLILSYKKSIDNFESAVLHKTKDFGNLTYNGKDYTWSCPYIDSSFADGKKKTYSLKKIKKLLTRLFD